MLVKSYMLCTIVSVTLAAIAEGPLYPKPEIFKNVSGCYIPELDTVLSVGTLTPGRKGCMGYRCQADSIAYETCSAEGFDPPCKLVSSSFKSYPGCCPQVVCP